MLQQKPCSRNVEIPGGRGVIKDPLGTEIPKGWGGANQKPSVGGVWIFSGTTQWYSAGALVRGLHYWNSRSFSGVSEWVTSLISSSLVNYPTQTSPTPNLYANTQTFCNPKLAVPESGKRLHVNYNSNS